jgi:hypothetical protein
MVADKRTLADTQLLSIRNQLLIGDFPFKTSIDRGFRYAMFDCRMVAEMEALYHIGPCAGITRHSARRLCILACSSWILNTATLWSSNMRMKTIQNHHVWGCLRARSFAYWHAQTAQRDCPLSTKTTVSESILYDHAKRFFLNGTLALALPTMISNHWGWWSFKFPPKKVPSFWGNVCRFESQWNLNRHGIAKMRYTHVVSSWDLCISNPWNGWAKEVKKNPTWKHVTVSLTPRIGFQGKSAGILYIWW